MIKAQSIETLKQNIDIVDIVGHYIELKRIGSNFSACCPFHNEKTPSFIVSPTKNLYHCYGCGVGGDVINFVMEYEKLNFTEAVEKIANLSNFTLEYQENYQKQQKFNEEYQLFDTSINFFKKQLLKHPYIYEYLTKRGLNSQSIDTFNLGYCSTSFEIIKFYDQSLLNKQKLANMGILGYQEGRYYARFSERIIFPIYSANGKPVGFGGRTLKDKVAKYINSPQSPLFNKSKLLYGYHLAKEFIYRERQIIITEGYLDTIMLHQAGFKTAVATLGTALTQEHLPLLNKGEPKIIVSYDGDNAGIKAAYRAALILSSANKEGGIVIFQNNMDPADMIFNNQKEQLKQLFSKPTPFIEFILRFIPTQFDLENPLQKEQALIQSLKFLHTLSPILQEEYKNLIVNILKIPSHLVYTKYKNTSSKTTQQNILPNFLQKETQLEELIIKYILENPTLLDLALQYIDADIFQTQKDAFSALIDQNYSHPKLIRISLNPKLILTPNGFENELRLLILCYNHRLLSSIQKDKTLNFEQKSFKIRKIKNDILKLKKGVLIAYESFSTF